MRFTRWLAGLVPAVFLAAPMTALAQGELVLYCTVQEEWCRPMVAAFEKQTGIRVLMTRKSSGEFYAQIKAEAANPRGDVWWGGTGDPHLQAAEEGLTEAYRSPRMGELQDWAIRQYEAAKGRTIGVYAVASFAAGTRRRELAIKAALGATRRELVGRTLREELLPVAWGLLIGVAAAAATAPRLGALLFRASPFEPWSYGLACASLLTAALLAAYAPAKRAAASNPTDLLRL